MKFSFIILLFLPLTLLVKAQQAPDINSTTCRCSEPAVVLPQKYFYGSLGTLLPYETFKKVTGWQLADDEAYKSLFYRDLQETHDSYGAAQFYSLTCVAMKPLRLVPKGGGFTLNLSPCRGENKVSLLDVTLNYRHDILKYEPSFEEESFNHTARAYMNILMRIAGKNADGVLMKILVKDHPLNLKETIAKLGNKYNVTSQPGEDADETANNFINVLKTNNINFDDVVLDNFILSSSGAHPLDDKEGENLQSVFSQWMGDFSIEDIDKMIYPQVKAVITAPVVGVEISNAIIRPWDALNKKPATDNKGSYLRAEMTGEMIESKVLQYDGAESHKLGFSYICIPNCEITGTGILLSFDNGYLGNGSLLMHQREITMVADLFITDSAKGQGGYPFNQAEVYTYDSLLTDFSGLTITKATAFLPFKDKVITAPVGNMLLNDKFIAGTITLPTPMMSDSWSIPTMIELKIDNETISISSKDLQAYFNGLGFTKCNFKKRGGRLMVSFKKVK